MNSLKFQDRLLGLQDNLLNFAYMLTANREEAKDERFASRYDS